VVGHRDEFCQGNVRVDCGKGGSKGEGGQSSGIRQTVEGLRTVQGGYIGIEEEGNWRWTAKNQLPTSYSEEGY
jgi:hypothetical protein